MVRPTTAPAIRFWSKVNVTDTCWLWTAGTDKDGYGIFYLNGRGTRAHRYPLGDIPLTLEPDHLCRVRNCVRPDHLEVVTVLENVMRSEGVAAINASKTHCVNGHEFNEANTRLIEQANGRPRRVCRACAASRALRSYHENNGRQRRYDRTH